MSPAVALQYLFPHRFLSRLVMWATRVRFKPWKNLLIRQIVRRFNVNMTEAAEPDLDTYPHFNAFFTRALKAGARTADVDPQALLMPADGKISQVGRIEAGRIFQAKGQSFTAAELLGDETAAAVYVDGWFANVYLSPRDYHRVHMPWRGRLTHTLHVPGRLFSVAPWAVNAIPRLFARNERLVCHFDTDFGPMCSVMVGALLVSGVETVWNGVDIPPYASRPIARDWRNRALELDRFAEMARFNMGSTVILLFPKAAVSIDEFVHQQPVKVGQRLGLVRSPS
ncbi:MAG: archaetidylserine decarboxylase [Pseudomarimonas sp.]